MTKKRKILYVITKATAGGAQKYVYDLATNLPKNAFDPIVAYGAGGKLVQDLLGAGVTTKQLPSLGRDIALISDIKSFFEMLRFFREIRPDIVHLNSSKAAGLGTLAARITGVPTIIFTVHGWPFKEDRLFFARFVIYLISWFTALLSTSVIVVSKKDEVYGKRMWYVGNKIHHIPLGAEPPQYLSRADAASTLSIQTRLPRLVTVAELTKNKGIRYAIDAVAELKKRGTPVSYFIIGDGEEKKHLVTHANRLGVSEQVRFLGFVTDAASHLRAFDVFLLPSVKEGMPYVLLEAATAGLPIVATDIVQQELAQLPNVRFVPPHSGAALATAVADVLKEPHDAAQKNVMPSRSEMLEKTITLYA